MIKERCDKNCGKLLIWGGGCCLFFLRDILAQDTVAQAACGLLAAPSAGRLPDDCCYIPQLAEHKSYPVQHRWATCCSFCHPDKTGLAARTSYPQASLCSQVPPCCPTRPFHPPQQAVWCETSHWTHLALEGSRFGQLEPPHGLHWGGSSQLHWRPLTSLFRHLFHLLKSQKSETWREEAPSSTGTLATRPGLQHPLMAPPHMALAPLPEQTDASTEGHCQPDRDQPSHAARIRAWGGHAGSEHLGTGADRGQPAETVRIRPKGGSIFSICSQKTLCCVSFWHTRANIN